MSDSRTMTRRQALAAAGGCLTLALAGCGGHGTAQTDDLGTVSDRPQQSEPEPEAPAEPVDPLAEEVDAALAGMSLEEKVWQLFVVRPEAVTEVGTQTAAGEATREALAERPVGGICYFGKNLVDQDQTRAMLSNTAKYAEELTGLPIFLCVDEEGGTVTRVAGNSAFGVDDMGDMRAIGDTGDTDKAYDAAVYIGTYLSYLGFNVDFAPDADIANNPEGTMSQRSFGDTADAVAPMVAAQVRGFTETGILCSAKHFPGIGGAVGDSHDQSIYSEKTLDEIREEELRPFEAAIEEDVPFVMVGHLSMSNVTGDNDPASISSELVTDVLREELGFEGIIITDSFEMGAATSALDGAGLAVAAIDAGVDMVLMPADLVAAYQGVMDAVAAGDLTEERIDESVSRILRVKLGRLSA